MNSHSSDDPRVDNPRRLARREDVQLHVIDGEGILFEQATGNTHRLNATALDIWRLCDGRRDRNGISAALRDRYEVSGDEAVEHVDRVLEILEKSGLLLDSHKDAKIGSK